MSFIISQLANDTGATELGPPPVDWMASAPSIQPIGPAINAGTLGNPGIDMGTVYIDAGASSPGTLGVVGSLPSFAPYPIVVNPVSSPPSLRAISVAPLTALDVSASTAAPLSGGVRIDATDTAAPPSKAVLVGVAVVALLVFLNL